MAGCWSQQLEQNVAKYRTVQSLISLTMILMYLEVETHRKKEHWEFSIPTAGVLSSIARPVGAGT